jgi:quinol monooxygenase YgiN
MKVHEHEPNCHKYHLHKQTDDIEAPVLIMIEQYASSLSIFLVTHLSASTPRNSSSPYSYPLL